MKITPLEIRQKSFEKTFRGYDKDEVQGFLNSLSSEWERLMDDNKELRIKLKGAENEVEKMRQVEHSLYKTLKTAEDTGANIMEQANKSAELQIRESRIKSESLIHEAKQRARRIVEQSEKDSRNILDELIQAVKELEQEYYYIENLRDSLISQIRNLSNDSLERVEKVQLKRTTIDLKEYMDRARNLARGLNAGEPEASLLEEYHQEQPSAELEQESYSEAESDEKSDQESSAETAYKETGPASTDENTPGKNHEPTSDTEVEEESVEGREEKKKQKDPNSSFFDELD